MLDWTKRRIDALPAREKEYFVWDDQLKARGQGVPQRWQALRRQTFRRARPSACRSDAMASVIRGGQGTRTQDHRRHRRGQEPEQGEESRAPVARMAELADRFLKEYVPDHCKPRTRVEYRHAVERYILPALGSIKVTALRRDDVAALHHEMRDKPVSGQTGRWGWCQR